jgi:hypothetical protein
MPPNVGNIDRIIRRLGAHGWPGMGPELPLATGLVKICPTRSLLGINTRGLGNSPSQARNSL